MANTLIKDPIVDDGSGGGGGGGGGGGSGGGGGGGEGGVGGGGGGVGGTVPTTPGTSSCFASFFDRVVQMWPPYAYSHAYIEAGGYFLVTSLDGLYAYHVYGVCSGGYVQISYTTIGVIVANVASVG